MEKKVTKKDMYTLIASLVEREDVKKFCAHEIELLDNKKKGSAKVTAKEEAEMTLVYEALKAVGAATTVSGLLSTNMDNFAPLANSSGTISTQKVSAVLKKLKEAGKVTSYADKKNTMFKVAD